MACTVDCTVVDNWCNYWRPLNYLEKRKQRKHMEKIMKDPEIAELARLAGIRKKEK